MSGQEETITMSVSRYHEVIHDFCKCSASTAKVNILYEVMFLMDDLFSASDSSTITWSDYRNVMKKMMAQYKAEERVTQEKSAQLYGGEDG